MSQTANGFGQDSNFRDIAAGSSDCFQGPSLSKPHANDGENEGSFPRQGKR